jgi:protein SCO1
VLHNSSRSALSVSAYAASRCPSRDGRARPPAVEPNSSASVIQRRVSALVGLPWFWVGLLLLLFGVPFVTGLRGRAPPSPPVLSAFPPLAEARGAAFVANVICHDCGAEGALAAETMRLLQHRSRNLGDALHLISFAPGVAPASVDELRRRAGTRWQIVQAAPGDVLAQFPGGRGLVLVDEKSRVRGRYDGHGPAVLDAVLRDASVILNSR